MDKKVLALAGITAMVSVGTYVVLTLVKPHKQEHEKVAEVYSADQIFQGTLDPNAADETPASGTESETMPESPATETTASAEAATSADAMTTPVETGTAEATAPTPPPAQEQTAAAEPALAQPAEPAQPEPAPAPAAVEPPAPAAPAEPAPKRAKHAPAKKSSAAAVAPAAKAWWPAENPNQLSLIYAGSASFKKAIVLMFNGAFFKPDSPNATLKVTDASGATVSGTWELGENNRRMLVFPVSGPGRYTVSVGADLTDSKDRKLGTALSGTVVIN